MSLLHLHASNLHAGVVVLRGIVGAGDQRALDSLQHVRQFRASQVNQAPLPGRCSRRRVFLSRARMKFIISIKLCTKMRDVNCMLNGY